VTADALRRWKDDLHSIASTQGVSQRDVVRQLCLHLPSWPRQTLLAEAAPFGLRQIISERLENRRRHAEDLGISLGRPAREMAASSLPHQLRSAEWVVKTCDEDLAATYEQHFHYMGCPRDDSILRMGLYAEPDEMSPTVYAAVSRCDRQHVADAVSEALGLTVPLTRIATLTRVFGNQLAGSNATSALVATVSRRLNDLGFTILVTAVNPFLGFSGASMRASGFVPFALADVYYGYDRRGHYCTRRQSGSTSVSPAVWVPPRNILMVRSTGAPTRRHVHRTTAIAVIAPDPDC